MASNEFETMLQCTDKIIDHLAANDPLSVGASLVSAGLLPLNIHSEISLPGTPADRARKIAEAMTLQVNATPSNFSKFISVLQKKRLNDLAKMLQDKLRELSGENMATAEGPILDQRGLSDGGTVTPAIDSMPTLKQLKLMEIGSEEIKITEITCNAWKTMGELLDFDDLGSKVSTIEKETRGLEDCLIKVLRLWMKGESRDYNPASWRTFIILLRDSGHRALAKKIGDHFK